MLGHFLQAIGHVASLNEFLYFDLTVVIYYLYCLYIITILGILFSIHYMFSLSPMSGTYQTAAKIPCQSYQIRFYQLLTFVQRIILQFGYFPALSLMDQI